MAEPALPPQQHPTAPPPPTSQKGTTALLEYCSFGRVIWEFWFGSGDRVFGFKVIRLVV